MKKAFKLYEQASELGHLGARLRLARIYISADAPYYGVKIDFEKAFYYYKLAALENDDTVSQYQVIDLHKL